MTEQKEKVENLKITDFALVVAEVIIVIKNQAETVQLVKNKLKHLLIL